MMKQSFEKSWQRLRSQTGFARELLLLCLFIFGLMAVSYYTSRFRSPETKIIGNPAPHFKVDEVRSGESFVSESVFKKKLVLLNFWASWCDPCRDEMPVLNSLSQSFTKDQFEIVALMEDDLPTLEKMRAELGKFEKIIPIHFPVYFDRYGQVADFYGTYKIPESYLVDLDGKVIERFVGAISEVDKEKIVKIVNQKLGLIPAEKKE